MNKIGRKALETALGEHYAGYREAIAPDTIDEISALMMAEDAQAVHTARLRAQMRQPQHARIGMPAFVAAQVRYIPAWTWVVQAALIVLMYVVARTSWSMAAVQLIVGILSAASVLVGVPTIHASKQYGVAELEYACEHNTWSVMVARLIVLGCSSALAVALMVGVTASATDANVFSVALWAAPPFFFSSAGSLAVLRKANPSVAVVLSLSWTLACCAALLMCASTMPELYFHGSRAVWAAAATLAGGWLVREIACTLRTANAGLDSFSPQLARTYN